MTVASSADAPAAAVTSVDDVVGTAVSTLTTMLERQVSADPHQELGAARARTEQPYCTEQPAIRDSCWVLQ